MSSNAPAVSSHKVSNAVDGADEVAPTAPRRVTTRTRLRITRRGRGVVALLAAAPIVVAVAVLVINGGAALGSDDTGRPVQSFEHVTVLPGDTLWSIARDVAPAEDPRDVVDAISSLNRLTSSTLDAGQHLFLPIAYSAGR